MQTADEIKRCTDLVDRALESQYDHTNPDEVSGKISEYVVLLALTTEMCASAESICKQEQGRLAEKLIDKKIGANEKKQIIEGKTSNLIYLVRKTERQNATLTHGIDGLRSQLSFIKSDMERSRFQQG